MGFWSRFKKKQVFEFSNDPQSQSLKAALEEASRRPLSDLTFRLATASRENYLILDVGLVTLSSAFRSYEQSGIEEARPLAAKIVMEGLRGNQVHEDFLSFAALAFFDRIFTVGANKGKTNETAWNTLTLDVEIRDGRFRATRGACRLEFPSGRIDLDADPLGLLGGLFGR